MTNYRISDYVALAEASYADFSLIDFADLKAIHAVMNDVDQPENLAKYITDNYEVVAHWKDRGDLFTSADKDQSSGFSGTLFHRIRKKKEEKEIGAEYVLALRGTAGGKDLLITDGGDIVNDGLAHHQIVDMYNFWQQITAPKGEPYNVMRITTLSEKESSVLNNILSTFSTSIGEIMANSLKKEILHDEKTLRAIRDINPDAEGLFVDSGEIKLIKRARSDNLYQFGDERRLGLGIPVSKVTTTGHSLGGHLSAAFSRLFPDKTEHSYMVNGAGFGAPLNPLGQASSNSQWNIASVFSALNGADHFDYTKVTNLIGDKNIDVVANNWFIGLSQPGKTPELFIEEAGIGKIFGHAAGSMSDTMQAASLFFAMDGKLNQTDLSEALKTLNPVFEAVTNDDEETLEKVVYQIGKLLGDKVREQAATRNELYERIASLKALLTGKKNVGEPEDAQGGKYQFVSLATDAGSWKDDVSQNSDKGTALRYALRELNPFAVVGADYTAHNRHGNLNLYSIENPYDMTDTYLQRCWIGRLRQ